MKLYLARHGETNSNLQKRVVCFNDQLTDNGRQQAQKLAERISDKSIKLIITSPHKRAKETSEIIAKTINKDVQEIALLGEKKWPSEIEGKPLNDPEVKKFFDLMIEKNNTDPSWHYRDEENFIDTKKRAEFFIEYISGLDEINILAISHEYFIKLIVSTMIFKDELTYDIFRSFFHSTSIDNTSLTLCSKEATAWKLVALNNQL